MISGIFTFGLLFKHFFLFSCCLYFKPVIWKRNVWCNNPDLVRFVFMMDGKTNLYTHTAHPLLRTCYLALVQLCSQMTKKHLRPCQILICVLQGGVRFVWRMFLQCNANILQTRTVVVVVWDLQVNVRFISDQYVNPANLLRCAFLVL